jgi:hypothetical protein
VKAPTSAKKRKTSDGKQKSIDNPQKQPTAESENGKCHMLVFCVMGKMSMLFSKAKMSMDLYAASVNGHCIMFVCFNTTIKLIA